MSDKPLISVVVICYNEAQNIGRLIESLAAQTLPLSEFEILIVDNQSTDTTRAVVSTWQEKLPLLQWIENPIRNLAISRNVGWQHAKGAFIAYTDADCIVPPQWLAELHAGFSIILEGAAEVGAVGGGNIAPTGDAWLEALGVSLNSFWGSHGSTQGTRFAANRLVPHIPTLNIMYRRKVLDEIGGFDSVFARVCEDPELNHRVGKAGYSIVYRSGIEVIHKMRSSPSRWFRNVMLYGYGRVFILVKHPNHFHVKFIVPLLLVVALLVAIVVAPWNLASLAIPIAYLGIVFLLAWRITARANALHHLLAVWFILAGNPVLYGIGEVKGILDHLRYRGNPIRQPNY